MSYRPMVWDLRCGFGIKGVSGMLWLVRIEKGVLLLTAKDKLRLLPPLTITLDELEGSDGCYGSCTDADCVRRKTMKHLMTRFDKGRAARICWIWQTAEKEVKRVCLRHTW